MAARAGMANLIKELRALCNAGATDYVVGTVAYFTDDQLQDELDAQVEYIRSQALDPILQRSGTSYVWKEFAIPDFVMPWLEEEGAGTGGWAVRDTFGVAKTIVTDYTVNYRSGVITFVVDQVAAPSFYLDCRSYDLFAAAAAVWRMKAGMEARSIDWSSNGVDIKASQRRDYCLKMAAEMESRGGGSIHVGTMYRTDEV